VTLVLRGGVVFDSGAGELVGERTVVIEGDRILEVSDGPVGGIPTAASVLDLGGRTVLPGLIDAHVHVAVTTMDFARAATKPASLAAIESAKVLERMRRRGFTTVRDAAGADPGVLTALERGLIPGPRVLSCGKAISQTGGHGDSRGRHEPPLRCACELHDTGIAVLADGADAVRRAAREQLRRGAHAVKVMASGGVASPSDPLWLEAYTADELAAAVEEAARWRTYVLAHAYTPGAVTRAVEAGVRTIEHGNLVDQATVALMAERGAWLVPTLVTYWAIAEHGAEFGLPRWAVGKVDEVLAAGVASLELARAAGVSIGFGTDLLGETHDFQGREFSIRSEVCSGAEVLRQATAANAAMLGLAGEIGVIAPGARADLVVVDGDPTADLSLLDGQGERIPVIVQAGEVVVDDR